jgi:PE family
MTNVLVPPEALGLVAADVESIGAAQVSSHAAAAARTTGVESAAADEVSAAVAAPFPNTLRTIRSWQHKRRRFSRLPAPASR